MNCQHVREELELLFAPGTELPDDVREHIDGCFDCQEFHRELQALVGRVDVDDVEFSEYELEGVAASVDKRIQAMTAKPVVAVSWLRYLTRVAAVFLVVAVSYGSYLIGHNRSEQQSASAGKSDLQLLASSDSQDEELDDEMVSLLIEDYSAKHPLGASEGLLDDITDEEMDYLVNNFNVGDML